MFEYFLMKSLKGVPVLCLAANIVLHTQAGLQVHQEVYAASL